MSSGTWGEVPPQQGGVIIPYLVKVPIKAGTSNQPGSPTSTSISSASFGFADCLKWGYNGTIDIAVLEMKKAASFLGVDLAEVAGIAIMAGQQRRAADPNDGWLTCLPA